MSTLTIRIPESRHSRLRNLAQARSQAISQRVEVDSRGLGRASSNPPEFDS
jgi:hypothetical protein